jgi:RHS repeat-associated protein
VENAEGQTKTITNTITEGSQYYALNQYEKFDQWALEYDKNGNLTQKGTQQFTYDYRDQLVKVEDGSLEVEMKYDVMGRRTQKVVIRGSQSKTRNFYYSGSQLIEERNETDQVTRQYFYGNGIDEILRMDVFNGATKTAYYSHTDANGSVTAITDESGNLVERVTYDTYGMPSFWDSSGNQIPASTIGNTLLFQGREYDSELNLYYYRYRYYDPIMGRFLQTDPMGYADSMNLYQGFGMNPGNFIDPFGLSALQPSVIGTSPGEMMLYHTDPEFKSYVDGCNSGFGQAFTNPMTYVAIGLTIINPAVGIAFGFGALSNSYYHSVKDRIEEGQPIGKSLGGGLKDISGISNIEAGIEENDPYKSGELVAEGSTRAAATIAAVIYFGRYALQKIKGAVNVKGAGNTKLPVKYDPEFAAKQLYGKEIKMGTISNEGVRALYDPFVKKINTNVPYTRANAEIIHSLRNAYKRLSRDLMADRAAAARLDENFPIQNFDYYVKKYTDMGFSGEALWRRIIEGGKTPNESVSKKFGIND